MIFNLLPFNFIKCHFICILQKRIKMVYLCDLIYALHTLYLPALHHRLSSSRRLKTWYTHIQELIYNILVLKADMFLWYLSSIYIAKQRCKSNENGPPTSGRTVLLGYFNIPHKHILSVSMFRQFFIFFLFKITEPRNYPFRIQPTECAHFQSLQNWIQNSGLYLWSLLKDTQHLWFVLSNSSMLILWQWFMTNPQNLI